MGIVALTCAGGAPGVTTTALGLALNWPRDVLLADCDRHPNQAVLAGYLRGLPAGGRGLTGIAQGYRTQDGDTSVRLVDQSVVLDEGSSRRRRFLPGFTHPRAALLFERYWPRLVGQFEDLAANHTDVLADCGRLDADGLPESLIAKSEAVLLVTRSDLPSLASVRLFLPELLAATAGSATDLLLVVVGGGRPYHADEIATQLELPLLGDIAWDPESAAYLSSGTREPKHFTDRPLWRGMHALSIKLATRLAVADPAIAQTSRGRR